ncbi:CPBP family intramembrane glutamic endopeptidase [Streptomyces sp. S.PNR 29]|uniref:CPBP family intramembrane glutamic endopeptidase n=1 Tax=Streptomyces sp. S.PNR 29 TaxID=2973805 RepID=UPI0025AEE33E|nr:CPBP family intramembrane glutamic endopeptidase [Streptomyces sp. S.PNR 29]MDN0196989.1 CPBP family intramembrane metalloprotease [Streptomyces sp. S.PNR 29]
MTTASPDLTALPYHRMAHCTGRHRWWRSLLGTLLVLGGWLVLILLLFGYTYVLGKVADHPELPDGSIDFGPLGNTALELTCIAIALPVVLLAVRRPGRRPAGTVSSVSGRLRVGWLARCLGAAVPSVVLLSAVAFLLPEGDDGSGAPAVWVGWRSFLVSLAVLAVFVPLQAAAEEYVFRGWLMQAAGAFARSPWLAVLPQAALFAAAHGWGTPWGFASLLFFGLVAGWLTIRTGGLEAAVAVHALNNLLAFGLSAAIVDGLSSDETATDSPWQLAVTDMATVGLYAATVLWLTRRHPPQRTAPAIVPPAVPPMPYAQPPAAQAPNA